MTETTVTVRDRETQIVRSIGRARRQFIRWWTRLRIAGAAVLILAFLVGVLNYLNQRGSFYLPEMLRQIVVAFDTNAITELASLAITILVVDALYQHRETEREKRRLILQMGSPDNAFAREAVRALRARGWLCDGSVNRANLQEANLQEADLQKASLQATNLEEANLERVNLQRAYLERANLRRAQLMRADLTGGNLEAANLQEARLRSANFQEANLQGASLQSAYLREARLEEADLRHANLREAALQFTRLRGADLRSADLQGAVLEIVVLQEVNLQGADLRETDLRQADLQGTDLLGAKYNNATTWPQGFTPPPEAVNVDAEGGRNSL